jgi:hypothetical protein
MGTLFVRLFHVYLQLLNDHDYLVVDGMLLGHLRGTWTRIRNFIGIKVSLNLEREVDSRVLSLRKMERERLAHRCSIIS